MAKKKTTRRNLAPAPEGVTEQLGRVQAILGEHFVAAVVMVPGEHRGEGHQDVDVVLIGDRQKARGMLSQLRESQM